MTLHTSAMPGARGRRPGSETDEVSPTAKFEHVGMEVLARITWQKPYPSS
jgi:hypothetical protein